MHYSKSTAILKEIKKARNILLNVHVNPDLDAVGSAVAFFLVLKKMGKGVTIVCPSRLEENFLSLPFAKEIQTVDFSRFEFDKFDLFVVLDTGSYDRVTGKKEISLPDVPRIVIDHHKTNKVDGTIRLLDEEASATCEIVYRIFKDWAVEIDKDMATALFGGIAGDTVFFKYAQGVRTFEVATELLKRGADKDMIVENIYNSLNFDYVTFMGKFLNGMKFEKGGKFVWAALPYEEYVKFGNQGGSREGVADQFFQSIKGAQFGIAMLETEKGKLSVSFRSKKGTDVSKLAKKLGGGGHAQAAGATIHDSFDKAVRKVIIKAQLYHMPTSEVNKLG